MKNKLIQLLEIEAKEIQLSFEKASIEGEGTPQEVADRREAALVKAFLEKYFPFPYRVVKGNIIDSYGERSNSIDCIILSPSHPYTIDPKNDKASIIFADGVDYAIEVKPDLANKEEIHRVLEQIQSVKKLKRKRNAIVFTDNYTKEVIENSYRIPSFIFSAKTYVELRTLVSHIVDYYIDNRVPRSEQFDIISINNRVVLFNCRKNSYIDYGGYEGICYAMTNENTLAVFLLYLNKIMKSEPELGMNVLKFYITDEFLKQFTLSSFKDLDEKLKNNL